METQQHKIEVSSHHQLRLLVLMLLLLSGCQPETLSAQGSGDDYWINYISAVFAEYNRDMSHGIANATDIPIGEVRSRFDYNNQALWYYWSVGEEPVTNQSFFETNRVIHIWGGKRPGNSTTEIDKFITHVAKDYRGVVFLGNECMVGYPQCQENPDSLARIFWKAYNHASDAMYTVVNSAQEHFQVEPTLFFEALYQVILEHEHEEAKAKEIFKEVLEKVTVGVHFYPGINHEYIFERDTEGKRTGNLIHRQHLPDHNAREQLQEMEDNLREALREILGDEYAREYLLRVSVTEFGCVEGDATQNCNVIQMLIDAHEYARHNPYFVLESDYAFLVNQDGNFVPAVLIDPITSEISITEYGQMLIDYVNGRNVDLGLYRFDQLGSKTAPVPRKQPSSEPLWLQPIQHKQGKNKGYQVRSVLPPSKKIRVR